MSFRQVLPHQGGFQQEPNVPDSQNPVARAYATHMLMLHGIQVPHGADPTAMWRSYSAQLAAQRSGTSAAAAGESPDMGVQPGQIPPSQQQPALTPTDQGILTQLNGLAHGGIQPGGVIPRVPGVTSGGTVTPEGVTRAQGQLPRAAVNAALLAQLIRQVRGGGGGGGFRE